MEDTSADSPDESTAASGSRIQHQRNDCPHRVHRFQLIFTTVVALTVLALLLDVLLALLGGDSDQVRAAAETCATTYKMGFGAIVALLGSRAL